MPKIVGKCGRPKKLINPDIEFVDEGYIATDKFALELLAIISEMSNYKILTRTGPQKQRNQKSQIKNRKEIEKLQGILKQKLDIQEDKVFFLRNHEEHPKKYRIVNGNMIESNQYHINIDDLQNYVVEREFIVSIQRVFNNLNQETQLFLKELVKIFSQSDKSLKSFQEQFFVKFNLSSTNDFQEIKLWNQLYEISFDEKVSLMKSGIDQYKNKFSLKQIEDEGKRKVEYKRIDVLKNYEQNFQYFQSLQKSQNRPISLLIQRIYFVFHKFWIPDYIQSQ